MIGAAEILTGNIKTRMALGTVWVAGARILINATAFASTILLARLLTPADFGLVAIATAIVAVVSAVTELSLAEALIQHRDPTDAHFQSAWTLNVARSVLIGLVIAALAVPIARAYGDPRLLSVLLAIAAITAMMGAKNPKIVVFHRRLIFWQDFAFGVSQKVAGFAVAITVAFLFRSYWALVAGMIATEVCAIVLSYAFFPFRPRFRLLEMRELLSFSVWLTLGRAVNALNWRSDQLAIGYLLGSTQLGYFTVGDNLAGLPTREAIAPLTQTLFPAFARLSHDAARLREAYRRAHAMLCAIAFPVGIGFAVIAHPVVLLLMGSKWLPSVPMVQILTVITAIGVLTTPLYALAMATDNTKVLFGRAVRNLLIRVPFMAVGFVVGWQISIGPVIGIIWGAAASNIVGTLLNMLLVKRIINLSVHDQFKSVSRTFVGSAVMVIAAAGARSLIPAGTSSEQLVGQVVAAIGAGALAYGATLTILWLAQGKPVGPETEILGLVAQLRQKIRPSTAA